jgi:hypothetical protein
MQFLQGEIATYKTLAQLQFFQGSKLQTLSTTIFVRKNCKPSSQASQLPKFQ